MREPDAVPVLDAHVHFWDPRRLHYGWLEALPALQRPFGPDEYASAITGVPVRRVLVIEANCRPEENLDETHYFDSLDGTVSVAGIVAYAPLTDSHARDRAFAALAESPSIKGIRHNVQGTPPRFCLQPSFVAGVRRVGELGLVFDLCVTHDQMDDALELVRQCPQTTFVLDHCGKPPIRERREEPWGTQLAGLAAESNVWCKMSGLLTEAGARWQPSDIRSYADRVVELFGVNRMIYGSDWPVLTLAGTYKEWYDFSVSLSGAWSEPQRRAFYHDNAVRVYRL